MQVSEDNLKTLVKNPAGYCHIPRNMIELEKFDR